MSLLLESEADDLEMEFPITIATVPFRIPNSPNQPVVYYGIQRSKVQLSGIALLMRRDCATTEPACEHVEGGRYVGPEFQLGQVYDGGPTTSETDVVLYRPVYVCVSSLRHHLKSGSNFAANCAKLTQQNSKDRSNLLVQQAAGAGQPSATAGTAALGS